MVLVFMSGSSVYYSQNRKVGLISLSSMWLDCAGRASKIDDTVFGNSTTEYIYEGIAFIVKRYNDDDLLPYNFHSEWEVVLR